MQCSMNHVCSTCVVSTVRTIHAAAGRRRVYADFLHTLSLQSALRCDHTRARKHNTKKEEKRSVVKHALQQRGTVMERLTH
jgi:hypothetical protein